MSSEFLLTWASDTLVAVTILMVIVMLVRRPVARLFGPQIAYLLWCIPAARMIMPSITRTIEAPVETVQDTGYFIFTSPAADTVSEAVTTPFYETAYFWPVLWLGGAALFLLVQLINYVQQRDELLNDAVPLDSVDNIDVIEVAGVDSPFAFGLRRKYIALPLGFQQSYNAPQRELVLAHEMAHHHAGDLWANFGALIILSLHWFNPVAWLAWRQFRFDQEAACDARVIRQKSLPEKQAYGTVIAQAATGRRLAFASPLGSKNSVKERLSIMAMKEKSSARNMTGKLLVGGGLVSALALTATISYAVQPAPPEAPAAPEAPVSLALADVPEPPAPPAPSVVPAAPAPPSFGADQNVWISKEEQGGETKYIHKIKKDGRTIILRMDRELNEDEIEEAIEEAEESRMEAEEMRMEAQEARREAREEAEELRAEDWKDAKEARAEAREQRKKLVLLSRENAKKLSKSRHNHKHNHKKSYSISRSISKGDGAAVRVPSIHINETCSQGKGETVKVSAGDDNNRHVMRIAACGMENAKAARKHVLKSLIKAREEVASEDDVSSDVRKDILAQLDSEISRLRANID